jgi:hypothetical protein
MNVGESRSKGETSIYVIIFQIRIIRKNLLAIHPACKQFLRRCPMLLSRFDLRIKAVTLKTGARLKSSEIVSSCVFA